MDRIRRLEVHRGWKAGAALMAPVRQTFTYEPGEDRATLYVLTEEGWVAPLADVGPVLLDELDALRGVRFTIVAVQAYRDGAGCEWHADTPFDAQAILSLGAPRRFGIATRTGQRMSYTVLDDGDLIFMPSGFQAEWLHCIPEEPDVTGERCSLVFRTVEAA